MVKKVLFIILTFLLINSAVVYADDSAVTGNPDDAEFANICSKTDSGDKTYGMYPKCASSPNECGSNTKGLTPLNCIFLSEPIGGDPGYDLYKVTCGPSPDDKNKTICTYQLWHGEYIIQGANEYGPVQAILAFEEGKEYQGPFGLLYSYVGVVYKFLSGIIVGFVILIVIVGGIRMTTSAGNSDQFQKGKDMILKAVIGMVLWFTASLILYTINPTFFAF